MSGSPTPPGWYHDPAIPGGMRWWDGTNWTRETRPVPPPPPVPPSPPPPAAPAPAPAPPWPERATSAGPIEPPALGPSGLDANDLGRFAEPRSWWRRKRVLVPAGVVALAIVASVANRGPESAEIVAQAATSDTGDQIDRFADSGGDDDGNPSTTTNRSTTTSAAMGSTTATTVRAGSSTAVVVTEDKTSTSPTAGIRSSTTEAPTTRPPSTTTTAPPTSAPTTAPSTTATTQPTTTLAPTTTAAPTTSGCDPNYTGACVPIASDVDCLGGSGNGPAYVQGPVTVVGTDIYDLDRDNDGIGCETD